MWSTRSLRNVAEGNAVAKFAALEDGTTTWTGMADENVSHVFMSLVLGCSLQSGNELMRFEEGLYVIRCILLVALRCQNGPLAPPSVWLDYWNTLGLCTLKADKLR